MQDMVVALAKMNCCLTVGHACTAVRAKTYHALWDHCEANSNASQDVKLQEENSSRTSAQRFQHRHYSMVLPALLSKNVAKSWQEGVHACLMQQYNSQVDLWRSAGVQSRQFQGVFLTELVHVLGR